LKCAEQCRLLKAQWDGYSDGGFVALVLPMPPPIAPSLDLTAECRTPFRELLQFIVIAVMSVMSGTFPDTYGVLP
jgi:hypothetical protein